MPIYFNHLFFLSGKTFSLLALESAAGQSSPEGQLLGLQGNIIGSNTFWAKGLEEELGEVKEKRCGWEGLKKKKEPTPEGDLNIFISLCTKPEV